MTVWIAPELLFDGEGLVAGMAVPVEGAAWARRCP